MSTHDLHEASRWRARAKMSFLVFAGIGAFLLMADHWAHLVPYLPWLLLLACPAMHFFHHGHAGHRSHGAGSDTDNSRGPRR